MWASYRKRLKHDLDRWYSNGWVSEVGRTAILADQAKSGREMGLASALGILASVLFGFAAISFVAAHWEDVPRLGRLGLLLAAIWLGYGIAGWLTARNHRSFADAAILFAVAMFGASIMLISQMYNIDGNPPDGVLTWWIGALFAGVVLRSNPALALAMVLVCVWSSMKSSQRNGVHWPFLIGWAAVTAAFIWQRWRPGLHLSALALSLFVISIGYLLGRGHEHAIVVTIRPACCSPCGRSREGSAGPRSHRGARPCVRGRRRVRRPLCAAVHRKPVGGHADRARGFDAGAASRGDQPRIVDPEPSCAVGRLSWLLDRNSFALLANGRVDPWNVAVLPHRCPHRHGTGLRGAAARATWRC